jgi:hypothetical protein
MKNLTFPFPLKNIQIFPYSKDTWSEKGAIVLFLRGHFIQMTILELQAKWKKVVL